MSRRSAFIASDSLSFIFLSIVVGAIVVMHPTPTVAAPPVDDTIREEDRLGARSDSYSRVFDRAITALVTGDAATFRSMLSSTTVLAETRGPGAIDAIIKSAFIPFFKDFQELTEEIATAPTYDASGNAGIAIARSFRTTKDEKKPFVIYLIKEVREKKETIVVGNLLINTTSQVLHGATSTPRGSKHGAQR